MRVQHGILLCSLLLFLASGLWYAIDHQYLLVTVRTGESFKPDQAKDKTITLSWYQGDTLHTDTQRVLWPEHEAERIKNMVNAWLAHLQEERLLPGTVHVETVALVPSRTEAIINLSEPLFSLCTSIAEKAYLLEGLLMTICHAEPSITAVRFLVHNNLWLDDHLEMRNSIPTAGFMNKKIPQFKVTSQPLRTVIINPAGDSKRTGRIIGHEFERTLTLDAALSMVESLRRSPMNVLLTRTFGETVDSLHVMHMVNQRPTDLFIDLRCYETTQRVPEISVYYYAAQPETDFWQKKSPQLALVPINRTYLKHVALSRSYATAVSSHLAQVLGAHAIVHAPQGLPLTPLVGITQPSIVIECGVVKKEDFVALSQELSNFIAFYGQ